MSSTQKILFLVTQSDLGGAQRYVLALAKAARGSFVPIVAAGPDGGGLLFEECRKADISVHRLSSLLRPLNPYKDVQAVLEIRALIRSTGAELIHSNSSKAGVLAAAALIGMHPRPKLVYTVHGWAFLEPMSSLLRTVYRWAEHIAGWRRDATIVLSEKEQAIALQERLASQEKVHVIPVGISSTAHHREEARKKLEMAGVPRDALVIGCVANFYASKNLPALVDAFTQIGPQYPKTHLVLIGDGEERSLIEARRQALTSRIHLLGYQSDAREMMDSFDLFVLPSVKEGLPFALLEAMDAGLPCLATNVGGIPEVIENGVNGWLSDPSGLASALVHALAQQDQWKMISTKANATVRERFTDLVMTKKTLALYAALLKRQDG